MPDIINSNTKKVIALYLPQFHTIPENDEWWGKGFTEWTNTKKAKPLFRGHYQPKTPINCNYYDLSDVTVMEQQAKLAQKYGVYGFCYYHYWFKNGKKLLEKPIENMLLDTNVNIPFCLCWANENWSRNWDGGNSEIIMQQDYGTESDWEKHFQYLLEFFKDERYIKYNRKPIFVIYKPEEIESLNKMIDYWQERARESGFDGLLIVRQHPNSINMKEFDDSRIDYSIKFEPLMAGQYLENKKESIIKKIRKKINRLISKLANTQNKIDKPHILDYDEYWHAILNNEPCSEKFINGGFVSWDNTARKKNGFVFIGSNPNKFQDYFTLLLKKPSALNMVVVNAWNEWAEGAYLEPDEKYGYAYLEALKKAKDNAESMQ